MSIAAASLLAQPAYAAEASARYDFSLPAATLKQSLALLAQSGKVSIGSAEPIPNVRVRHLRGRMTVGDALAQLLAGLPLQARQVAPGVWRIERRALRKTPTTPSAAMGRTGSARTSSPKPDYDFTSQEIIVTATKNGMRLSDVPGSLSIVSVQSDLPGIASPSTQDVAQAINGMAVTEGTPGQNRVFLRGVADSPFAGPSQSTVAVILDEARLTFDAPDPELRLYDVERVEVLKGPQGPLYGTGVLGGIYRIVTHKPEFGVLGGRAGGFVTQPASGSVGLGANATFNIPISGAVAVRASGYAERTSGYIDTRGIGPNSNSGTIHGGRVMLRTAPANDWTLDFSFVGQSLVNNDSGYVFEEGSRTRSAIMREPNYSRLALVSMQANGMLADFPVVIAASRVWQSAGATYDASDKANVIGLRGPLMATIDHRYRIANGEARIESPAGSRIGWLAGAAYMQATDSGAVMVTPAGEGATLLDRPYRRDVEVAAFGNIDIPIGPAVRLALGARLFRNATDDEQAQTGSNNERSARLTGFTPSASLSFAPAIGGIVFLRVANGLRPGGLAPAAPGGSVKYDSDSLTTAELGWRLPLDGSRLGVTGAAYYSRWHDVQSDYLTSTGLIATRNAGEARIKGAEAELDWRPDGAWRLSVRGSYTDAQLIRDTANLELNDLRLPVSPEWTAAASASRRVFLVGQRSATVGARLSYIGPARLSFEPGFDREMGNYFGLSGFADVRLGRFGVTLRGDNLLGSDEEVFAYGNPFSIAARQQYVIAKPRTITLQVDVSF